MDATMLEFAWRWNVAAAIKHCGARDHGHCNHDIIDTIFRLEMAIYEDSLYAGHVVNALVSRHTGARLPLCCNEQDWLTGQCCPR